MSERAAAIEDYWLGYDNSTPPQLWVWRGDRDESAEPWLRIKTEASAVDWQAKYKAEDRAHSATIRDRDWMSDLLRNITLTITGETDIYGDPAIAFQSAADELPRLLQAVRSDENGEEGIGELSAVSAVEKSDFDTAEVSEVERVDWQAKAEALRAQLPDGMKHCTILFKQCEKGHGELTATNWIQHPCLVCERDQLRSEVDRLQGRYDAAELARKIVKRDLETRFGVYDGDDMDWREVFAEIAELAAIRSQGGREATTLNVRDLVKPVSPCRLRSGAWEYERAIVASLNPFTLVSVDGDMVWSCTIKASEVRKCGLATEVEWQAVQERLATEPPQEQSEPPQEPPQPDNGFDEWFAEASRHYMHDFAHAEVLNEETHCDAYESGYHAAIERAEQAETIIAQECIDWAETDDDVRNMAKRVLPAEQVDGNPEARPAIADIVEMLVELCCECGKAWHAWDGMALHPESSYRLLCEAMGKLPRPGKEG